LPFKSYASISPFLPLNLTRIKTCQVYYFLITSVKILENKGFTITFVGTDRDVKNIIRNVKIDESNTLAYNGTGEGLAKAYKAFNMP
jgi:hypothetical protein